MTFNDIFKSSFLNNIAEFSIVDTLIGLLFALALGLFIFIVYKKCIWANRWIGYFINR